jgi:transposase
LDLPGIEVTALERDPGAQTLLLHCRLAPGPVACPQCGQPTTRVHQWHRRRIRDLPWAGHRTWLLLTRRRLHCRVCGTIFFEPLAAVAPRATTTRRYAAHLIAACRDTSLAAVARREGVGYKLIEGLYYAAAAAQHPAGPPATPVRILGLDEIAARKGRGDFKLVIVNGETGAVVDQLAARDKATVRAYFAGWSAEHRAAVEEVTADFWEAYHDVAAEYFPQARRTGDRFHVQKAVNAALNQTRIAEQRGRAADERAELQELRGYLLRNGAALDPEDGAWVREAGQLYPALGVAYDLKERLRRMYEEAGSRHAAAIRLGWWVKKARTSGLRTFAKLADFMERWWETILIYFVERRSNGVVEGCNNKIKLIKRRAYGFMNDRHFRLRVLMECDGT